ncbi:t-SNARE [Amylocystis lapponica]|nr:t-SNARE [Amylocystis lapponica]
MAPDRLAQLRAQRQQEAQAHEMTGLPPQTPTSPTLNGAGNGEADVMGAFYAEVASIQDGISQFSSNVARIGEYHSRLLNSTDDGVNRQNSALLDDLVTQTRELSNSLKQRIQTLDAKPGVRPQDARIRKNQTALLRSKFVEVLQGYQNVERDYRGKYKQRVERQFKIVKPDATQEEVSAVVNDTQGGGDQIFAQALSASTRYGESRAAYREVQDRHQDIRRIEQTLQELAQMFNDMSELIAQQDDAINVIDTTAAHVETQIEAGLNQTEKAVKSARSARRKRWICFILVLVIIAILALVLGLVFGTRKNNNKT